MNNSREETPTLDFLFKKYGDDIRLLKELLKIKKLKECVEDIVLIRYILSYDGNLEEAADSIEKAILWRKKYVYPFMKNKTAYTQDDEICFPDHVRPYYPFIKKALVAWKHKSTIDNQPVVIARLKLCNFSLLLDHVPENILVDYIVYSNEHEFWVCNEQTKKNNILCRTYRFIDLKGFMLKTFDRRFLKVFVRTSKLSEFLHPQLVGKTYLVNAPSYIRVTIETLKRFGISKRTLNKLVIPKIPSNQEPADCDWFHTLVNKQDIPTYLGGNCLCKEGCIPGFQNNLDEAISLNIEEIKKEIKTNLENIKNKTQNETES